MKAFQCPKCGTSTWGNLDFCSECGHPLDKTCADCGFKVRHMFGDKYNFCAKCGGKMEYLK